MSRRVLRPTPIRCAPADHCRGGLTRTARILRALRCLPSMILGIGILGRCAMGAEPPTETVEEKKVTPAAISPEDLKGRVPILLEEYQRLKRQAEATLEAPAATRLIGAEYSATYSGQRLTAGRLTWSIQHVGKEGGSWTVQPLGLALKELKWGDQPAIWGSSAAERFEVLIDRPQGQLVGTWELDGEMVVRNAEFTLKIPSATISVLKLRVPTGMTVAVPGQTIPQSIPAEAGWNVWTISLGGLSECRIAIHPQRNPGPTAPLILARSQTLYGVRQEGLRYVTDFSLEVSQTPIQDVSLWVDRELDVYSISYGEISLPWKSEAVEGRQKLIVALPDKLLGTSRNLRLRGVAPIKTDQAWMLPQISVAGSAFDEGQTVLRISPPLQLQHIESIGCLQNNIETTPSREDQLTFKQFRTEGSLRVTIGKPRPRILARVLSDVQTKSPDWSCLTQLQLTAAEGAAFDLKCRIPAGWDVIEVRDVSSPKLEWSITTLNPGERLLVLHFLEALSADKPKTIEIDSSRGAGSADQAFVVPAFEPLNIDGLQMVVAINSTPEVRPVLEAGTSFEPCIAEELDSDWTLGKFWQTRLARRNPKPLLLRLNGIAPEGHFTLQSLQTPVEVTAAVKIDFAADKMTKSVALHVSPQHGRTERVLVFQSMPGPQFSWTLAGTPQRPVEARKLPTFRYAAWDLPTTGELWELRLPAPLSTPFVLEGTRTRGLPPTGQLGLVFVPQAQTFRGQVSITAPADLGLEVTAQNTEGAGGAESMPGPFKRSWTFHEADAALKFQTRVAVAQAPAPVIRRVNLEARWTLEPSGFDYYLAKLELGSGFRGGDLRIGLPEEAEIVEVQIDGQSIPFDRLTDGAPLILTNVADEQTVAITYRTASPQSNGPAWRGLLLPQLNIPVLRFDLELFTPAGFRLGGEPRGMVLKSAISSISPLQRVFGPLGRPSSDAWFNPFSTRHWSALLSPAPSSENSVGAAKFGPEFDSGAAGWQVFRGSAALLPERVEVWLWSCHQANGVAWLAFWGCLLLGATLRLARFPNRGILGSTALMAEILFAFILPSVPAQIAGACLAGTLLATLWPRSMISRPRPPVSTEPHISQDSTQSYRVAAARSSAQKLTLWGLVLTATLCVTSLTVACAAQPPMPAPNGQSPSAIPVVHRVIIPVDAQGKPWGEPALAYVPEKLLKEWTARCSRESAGPDWLMESGTYGLNRDAAGQITLSAQFEVSVLSTSKEVEVGIPLSGINFGGPTACLVDGQSQPILTRGDAETLFLRLPGAIPESKPAAPPMPEMAQVTDLKGSDGPTQSQWPRPVRKCRVEFHGYPILRSQASGSVMEFTLPKLNSARLIVKNGQADLPWALRINSLTQSVLVDQPLTVELGPIRQLRIENTTAVTQEPSAPKIEARLAAVADIQPALTRMVYQVKYAVSSGSVKAIALQLPPQLTVGQVTGPEVFDWRVETTGDGSNQLQIDLRSPQAAGFAVRIDATMPNDGPADQAVIPSIQLLSPTQERLRPLVSLVGVRSPSEFRIEAPIGAGEQIAMATTEDFLKEWNEVDLKPQLVLSLLDPSTVKVGLKVLTPLRTVRTTTTGVLGSRQLQWNLNATIEVQNAATYSHQFEVDPRLSITSVVIQEDAANRLLRWTRSGNLVQVFLRDKTTGTQTLSLQGTMPTQIPQELALPTIEFRDAVVADAKLQLYQELDLEVELSDQNKWEQLESRSEIRMGAARNLLVGRFKWPGDAGPFVVRAAQNEPVLNYSAITSLQPRDGRWKFETTLVFQVEKGHGSQFSIRVPPEIPLALVDAGDVRQLLEKEPDGGQRIVLIPPASVRGQFVVQVSGDVNMPLTGQAAIPEIVGLNATKRDHFVVLPEDAHLTVDTRTSSLIATPLPKELAEFLPRDLHATAYRQFLGNSGAWNVLVTRPQEDEFQTGVLWTETQIWWGLVENLAGRTTTVVGPQELENLEFAIPEGIALQGVLLDGEFIPHSTPQAQSLKIPLNFPQAGHVVTLYWTAETAAAQSWLNRSELQWPRVVGQSVTEQYLTLTPPTGFRARTTSGQSTERITVQLGELTVLLQLMQRRAADGPPPQDALWTFLQRRAAGLIKRLQGESRLQSASSELGQRFARLKALFTPWEPSHGTLFGQDEAMLDGPRPLMSLDGNLAGPHSLLIKFAPGAPQSKLAVSMIHESAWNWGFGLIIGVGVLCVVWPLLQWKFPEWLARHPALAWCLLGLIWWTCLRPSALGLLCFVISLALGLKRIRWPKMAEAA